MAAGASDSPGNGGGGRSSGSGSSGGGSSGSKPKLLLVGDRDTFCSLESFDALAMRLPPPRSARVVSG